MTTRITRGRRSRRLGHTTGYTATETAQGFELASPDETTAGIVLPLVFAAIWTGAVVVLTIVAFNVREPVMWIFVVVFWLAEVLVIAAVVKVMRIRAAWEESRLILDKWPLELGATASGWFARPLAGTTATPQPAAAKLILRESATYRVGTDTRTATEDVAVRNLVLSPANVDGIDGFRFQLTIDRTGPPTIQLDSNLVEWILEFDMSGTIGPDSCSLFTLLVAPRLEVGS